MFLYPEIDILYRLFVEGRLIDRGVIISGGGLEKFFVDLKFFTVLEPKGIGEMQSGLLSGRERLQVGGQIFVQFPDRHAEDFLHLCQCMVPCPVCGHGKGIEGRNRGEKRICLPFRQFLLKHPDRKVHDGIRSGAGKIRVGLNGRILFSRKQIPGFETALLGATAGERTCAGNSKKECQDSGRNPFQRPFCRRNRCMFYGFAGNCS